MTFVPLAIYLLGLVMSAGLIVSAVVIGWWLPALMAALFGGLWAVVGRWVLAAAWRPPEPLTRRTRRPVVRRRR